ncbi:MAG: single-stranded-DNA-specific exonuclease RecJ [Defluviitaleaceae bacterium]|nr:single-stranded-DNA-specific exonuclease RecJ [Defluviitaleaceae bacterium]
MYTNRWVMRETDADLELMSRVLNIREITANVMANRGIRSKNAALAFLAPSIDGLHDTLKMKDATKALERVAKAIPEEKITIYGDYDADGIMSTVILHKLLRRLGADCNYYIPHRIDEGYGLNAGAVEKLAESGTQLLITVDNGIAAVAEIELANSLGISTVIIDHHEPMEALPPAAAIVDPKQPDCEYPFKELCAAGLAFKIAGALCRHMDVPFSERDEFLTLSAVATLCDIVKLADENRIIVNCGLVILNADKLINPGLGSLIALRGYLDKLISTFTVGFVIGPCLNATGRLESADLAVELLLCEAGDTGRRIELARELAELNETRKKLTSECVERVSATLSAEGDLPKVLVITDEDAHESVAGIVAGRIRENTGHPTILLTQGDGAMKGSGRSIEAYNLFEALYSQRHLFIRFGGHAMAAGLTLPAENIPVLRDALNRGCTLTDEDFRPIIHIDRVLAPEEITLALSDELSRLAPFGKGNPEPLFVSYGLYAESVRAIDEKNTLIFTFVNNGRRLKGIAFGLNEHYATAKAGVKAVEAADDKSGGVLLDVVYSVETNEWNGNVDVQIRVWDFAFSCDGTLHYAV